MSRKLAEDKKYVDAVTNYMVDHLVAGLGLTTVSEMARKRMMDHVRDQARGILALVELMLLEEGPALSTPVLRGLVAGMEDVAEPPKCTAEAPCFFCQHNEPGMCGLRSAT